MENLEKNIAKKHSFNITDEKITVTGVVAVESFDEKEVILVLTKGGATLTGENFEVAALDVETGRLELSGTLICLKYGSVKQKQSFMKKLLK